MQGYIENALDRVRSRAFLLFWRRVAGSAIVECLLDANRGLKRLCGDVGLLFVVLIPVGGVVDTVRRVGVVNFRLDLQLVPSLQVADLGLYGRAPVARRMLELVPKAIQAFQMADVIVHGVPPLVAAFCC